MRPEYLAQIGSFGGANHSFSPPRHCYLACPFGFGTAPLARKPSISVVLNPSCWSTSSLCSPSSGARFADTKVMPCSRIGLLIVEVSLLPAPSARPSHLVTRTVRLARPLRMRTKGLPCRRAIELSSDIGTRNGASFGQAGPRLPTSTPDRRNRASPPSPKVSVVVRAGSLVPPFPEGFADAADYIVVVARTGGPPQASIVGFISAPGSNLERRRQQFGE